jgi:hypothetical protein
LVSDAASAETTAGNDNSPLSAVGTTVKAITVPGTAKYAFLQADAAIRWSEDATQTGYAYLPAYVESRPIPVADLSALYVRINAASGTTTVWFWFAQ